MTHRCQGPRTDIRYFNCKCSEPSSLLIILQRLIVLFLLEYQYLTKESLNLEKPSIKAEK